MAAEHEARAATPPFAIRRAALKPLHAILVEKVLAAEPKSAHAVRVLPAALKSPAMQVQAAEPKLLVQILAELLSTFALQFLTSSSR
jgi:hypothetical protein